ncbi:tetratricopeptide repeat protein [Helicobacter felis]|uniref:tetratricopeptide repeat protein n=1 Tax=Helicobacter felis TaxID=214 RepID=UPI0013158D3B|nr:tetratricopeptide repeat protein [Helicobacter felis]
MDSYESLEEAVIGADALFISAYDAHENGDKQMASEYLKKASKLYFDIAIEAQKQGDYDTAVECYKQSGNTGFPVAYFILGYIYESGKGVEQDITKAMEYYQEAGEGGYAEAYTALGILYSKSAACGLKEDYSKAKEYLQKAVDMGDVDAQEMLDLLKQQDKEQSEEATLCQIAKRARENGDYAKALEYLHEAIQQEDAQSAEAYYTLGQMYYSGQGVPKDEIKFRQCLEKSAAMGYARAFDGLGLIYELGKGVVQDYSKARACYLRASSMGCAWGYYHLGNLYELGRGVPKNPAQAVAHYQKAIEIGDEEVSQLAQAALECVRN